MGRNRLVDHLYRPDWDRHYKGYQQNHHRQRAQDNSLPQELICPGDGCSDCQGGKVGRM